MQEQKYMPSAMAANTKPEPDICMCKAWGKALTPPNGESGKGVIEGRRAADAFEKRAHIPTVCRRSLPGNHSAQTVRGGLSPRMPKAKPSEHAYDNPRVPCAEPEATKPLAYQWTKCTHPRATPAARRPGFRAAFRGFLAGSRRYLIPVIRDVRADGKVDEYVRGSVTCKL